MTGVLLEYTVVKVWQQPVEAVLGGSLGTLPLASLAAMERDALQGVVQRVAARLEREAAPGEADELWVATYMLSGLRYPHDQVEQLMRGVREMRESVTYQAILEEGREEGRVAEARALLALLGEQRFGPPDARARAALEAIADAARLEALAQRLLDAASWDDLLGRQP